MQAGTTLSTTDVLSRLLTSVSGRGAQTPRIHPGDLGITSSIHNEHDSWTLHLHLSPWRPALATPHPSARDWQHRPKVAALATMLLLRGPESAAFPVSMSALGQTRDTAQSTCYIHTYVHTYGCYCTPSAADMVYTGHCGSTTSRWWRWALRD